MNWRILACRASWAVAALCSLASQAQLSWPASANGLERFFDSVVPATLERSGAPGILCVVVSADRVLFEKGYGLSDIESGASVDPAQTLFRVGSISKLFVAAAALHLAERGTIELDADINAYLRDFQIRRRFPQPITAKHLLAHTAGFDERLLGSARPAGSPATPLADYLARRMPPTFMPPGRIHTYSNHGYTLLAYLVESASEMPFEQYVRANILLPLGMERSGFFATPERREYLSMGYDTRSGILRPAYDELNIYPAGSFMTTGHDMALFMMAQLGGGKLQGVRILSPDSIRLMHERQFSHREELPGRTFGFAEHFENGRRFLNHDGLVRGFGSRLLLSPELGMGIFVSANVESMSAPTQVVSRFLDRYVPGRPEVEPVGSRPKGAGARVKEVAGNYRGTRHVRSTFIKFGTLLPPLVREWQVIPGELPGSIRVRSVDIGAGWSDYLEVSPYLFKQIQWNASEVDPIGLRATDAIAFRPNDSAGAAYLFRGRLAFARLPWHQTRQMLLAALALSLAGSLSFVCYQISSGVSRTIRKPAPLPPKPKLVLRAIGSASLANLAFVLGIAAYLWHINRHPYAIGYGPPLALRLLLTVPLISALLTVAASAGIFLAWRKGWWGLPARLYFTAVALCIALFQWLANYWNLLGYRFG